MRGIGLADLTGHLGDFHTSRHQNANLVIRTNTFSEVKLTAEGYKQVAFKQQNGNCFGACQTPP